MAMTYNLTYTLIRKRGQKSLRMRFDKDGNLIVSVPFLTPPMRIEKFVNKNKEWIEKHSSSRINRTSYFTREELTAYIRERVSIRCLEIGLEIPQISFYNASSYWGICYPKKKIVRFSWRCCFLDEKQVDYVVVHELCHIVHLNHSSAFWEMVGKYCPDFKTIRGSIRRSC